MGFEVEEKTIEEIQKELLAGRTTMRSVVESYLERIEKYDRNGPEINSIITVNDHALSEADALDAYYRENGVLKGPLHGAAIAVKDQVETGGIRTTFGSIAFKSHMPDGDATIIRKIKEAGGIIIAKTNLPDFATAWNGVSSMLGETRNPYALNRDSGGSSSGTGAAVASSFCTVGVGEDTGGSIRVPSSYNNLYGIRVTAGLISRNRTSPLVGFQDTTGPMSRTVKDLAILLDVMRGFDPTDEYSGVNALYDESELFSSSLLDDYLAGKRIGILREAFGAESDSDAAPVNRVVENAISYMRDAGAAIIDPVAIEGLPALIEKSALYLLQSRHDINRFLESRETEDGVYTVERLVKEGKISQYLDLLKGIAEAPENPETVPDYFDRLNSQEVFRRRVMFTMAANRLDAILFPDVQVLPPTWDEIHSGKWTVLSFPTNTLIGSQTILPAISMPAGFTDDGIPVGVELLGKEHDEKGLIRLAYSYEAASKTRKPPHF